MTLDEFRKAFDTLKELRFERLAKGYTVETEDGPVNAGYFRDNIMDILEELADTVNILEIRIGRFEQEIGDREATPQTQAAAMSFFTGVNKVVGGVLAALDGLWLIDSEQDDTYRNESVAREVSRAEVGL